MSKIENEKQLPQIYYGLHMAEGVAEYRDAGREPYRIFLNSETIKQMDTTYRGKPVYVRHVDEVDLSKLREEADGYVVRSFYNSADGKHWVEFIVVSDRGHESIRNGWRLSNSYIPKEFTGGGLWHGVEYAKEVTRAEYEHLAIVPDPRYDESVILTPEKFKAYNEDKLAELKRLQNSKGEQSMFEFLKRKTEKVENAKELEAMSVILPKSKVEKTLSTILNEADEHEMHKMNDDMMADPEHHVMVGNEKMKVHELVAKHQGMYNDYMELKKKHDELEAKEDPAMKKPGSEEIAPAGDPPSPEHKKENKEDEEKAAAEKKKNDDEALKKAEAEKAGKTHNAKDEFYDMLDKAPEQVKNSAPISLATDGVTRGKQRYGSGN